MPCRIVATGRVTRAHRLLARQVIAITAERLPVEQSVPHQFWLDTDVQQALVERELGALCQLVSKLGGLRQEDLAMLTGLSQAFLSMLESGARRLTNIDKIIILLEGVNTPPELTGPMLRPPAGTAGED
ncbi:helix-turn-helix domain-containing protein [Streptomyces sp. NPDC019890]|uniref:helix-turn-helix domain-containing protein n=1 Tax=Streptomyces sp. NPDC019890 TaxID=3365064 RepID=UPI00384C7FCE